MRVAFRRDGGSTGDRHGHKSPSRGYARIGWLSVAFLAAVVCVFEYLPRVVFLAFSLLALVSIGFASLMGIVAEVRATRRPDTSQGREVSRGDIRRMRRSALIWSAIIAAISFLSEGEPGIQLATAIAAGVGLLFVVLATLALPKSRRPGGRRQDS